VGIDENVALVRRFASALNGRRVEEFPEIFAQDYILHDPGLPGGVAHGLGAIMEHTQMLYTGLPNFYTELQDVIAEGDKVVGRFIHRGTHTGPMFGMPPSGHFVAVEAINIYRIANGKLAEAWGEVDTIGLLQQLGAMPSTPST